MEFEYKGYTLDDEIVYVDRDGDLVMVTEINGNLKWRYEEEDFGKPWQDWDNEHVAGLRPVGSPIAKEPTYQIGKYYLMGNGGDSLFRRLGGIEERDATVYIDEYGFAWRGIEVIDPECLGLFE